jgi:hypothetical protein
MDLLPKEVWLMCIPRERPSEIATCAGVCRMWRRRVIEDICRLNTLAQRRRFYQRQLRLNQSTLIHWLNISGTVLPPAQDLFHYWMTEMIYEGKHLYTLYLQMERRKHIITGENENHHSCWCTLPGDVWEEHKQKLSNRAVRCTREFYELARMV